MRRIHTTRGSDRRRVALLAAVCLAAAGCATATQEEPDSEGDGPVELRFQSLAFQESTIKASQDIVDAWNADNPDVQVSTSRAAGTPCRTSWSPSSRAAPHPMSSTTSPRR